MENLEVRKFTWTRSKDIRVNKANRRPPPKIIRIKKMLHVNLTLLLRIVPSTMKQREPIKTLKGVEDITIMIQLKTRLLKVIESRPK